MPFSELEKKFDKNGMKKLIMGFPKQCRHAIGLAEKFELPPEFFSKKFDKILILGMGGSGIGGMLSKELFEKQATIPIETVAGYDLPNDVNENSLVFAISYSGNTEETLSAAKKAKQKNASIIAVTSGGFLEKECENRIILPKGFPPRTALGYLFLPIAVLLKKLKMVSINENPLIETISHIEKNSKKFDKIGQNIAKKLFKKIPVIYANSEMNAVACRWHTQISENSKQFSHYAVFPELNHNEITGYRPFESKLVFVMLRDKNDNERIKQRIDLTKKIVGKKSSVVEVFAEGNSKITKTISLIWIGDIASYYLALLNNIDPREVKNIEFLKKSLGEKGFFA